MNEILNEKLLIIIFDALPYQQFINYGYKYVPNIKKKDLIKLESLIGYSSGLYPSIWTGKYPDNLNYWTDFKFDINNAIKGDQICNRTFINKLINILFFTPPFISKIVSIILAQLSQRFNIFSYKYPTNFDFKLKKMFSYEDHEKFIFHPEKTRNENIKTIFSLLKEKKISYRFLNTYRFIDDFSVFKENIIFYYNSIMDLLGHKYGIDSKIYQNKIKDIFEWVNNLIPYYKLILFSDHGMTKVNKKFFPLKIFKELKLRLYKDLIVWFDSTILKIWFNSIKSLKLKSEIIKLFNKSNSGHFITKKEKKKYGLNFYTRYFGDLIFIVDPHYEIIPNFFNIFPYKNTPGLHGYSPTHISSYGIFYSNFLDFKKPMNVIDIFPKLVNKLNFM